MRNSTIATPCHLSDCKIGPKGVRALAKSPHLKHLAELDLGYNKLTAAAITAFAKSPIEA